MGEVVELRPRPGCGARRPAGPPVRVAALAAARDEGRCPAAASPLLFWSPLVALWVSLWVAPFGLRIAPADEPRGPSEPPHPARRQAR
jgi:hypothetical protein